MRIPFEQMKAEIKRGMIKAGLTEEQANTCAQVHTESSRDGVYSHGLNRVPRFIDHVNKGWVDISATPTLLKICGCMENYDGNMGIGILNAKFAMNRAMELAKENNIGIIALRNTTHWMRGGTYAWDAVVSYLYVGQTQSPVCQPGAQKILVLVTIHFVLESLEKTVILYWIWQCHSILMASYKLQG